MKLQYMGTAAAEGIPALFCTCETCARAARAGGRNLRLRSGMLVNDAVMVDFPPDMLINKIRFGLNLDRITDIFFTHSHIDHLAATELCYFDRMYAMHRDPEARLRLWGNEKVLETIRDRFVFDMEQVPTWADLLPLTTFQPVCTGDIAITPLPAYHDARENCFLFLLEASDSRVLLANDTTMLPEETFSFLKGKHLCAVSLDCTAGKFSSPRAHMGFPDNLAVRNRLLAQGSADVQTCFLSHHFSHNGQINYDDFPALAKDTGFLSTYDGMILKVDDECAKTKDM